VPTHGEELGQPLAEDRGVLGDDHPQWRRRHVGSSTVTTVGPPSGLSTRNTPSTVCTRSIRPARPPPACGVAPPRPSSVTHRRNVDCSCFTCTCACRAPLCLEMLVSISATQKYAIDSRAGE